MRVLITGGAGFIGSWVAEAFLKNGYDVLVLDNLSTGKEANVPKGASFLKGDIRDYKLVEGVFSDFKPDIVNHHAAQINVRYSVENPIFDAEVNIIGTINLLELSVKHGVERFIFASTGGAIYGEPSKLPADETTPPVPISPYGVSKYSVETYLGYYRTVHGLNYTALRYSNVYGPRQNPHGEAGVVAIFCSRILQGKPCLIYGDGNQTRDYVFVGDVAEANLNALKAQGGIYNIGTGRETSVNELVSVLKKVVGKDFKTDYAPPVPGEVRRISLDIGLAKRVLGWSPKTELEEGLALTWDWFKEKITEQ